MMTIRLVHVCLAALACTVAATARAAAAGEVTSRVFGTDASQTLELGKSHRFITISTDEIVVTDGLDDGHPLKNLSGTCAGSLEVTGSVFKGGGFCVYSNAQGGKWLLNWDIAADGSGGGYRLVGTEGNATGWKGSGRWGQNVEFPRRRYLQTWSGSVEKP